MRKIAFTKRSSNAKTGPIPVTTSSRKTCPEACPFNHGGGCYADAGYYTRLHWDKVTSGERGLDFDSFLDSIAKLKQGQVWRHNVAGDLDGDGRYINTSKLAKLVKANTGKRGFTYTHYPMSVTNLQAVKSANDAGFTVNVSSNSIAEAVKFKRHNPGLPVVTVAPSDHANDTQTIDGVKVVTCPATYRDDITCASCKLCSVANRAAIVAFPAHGGQTKQADIIARG